MTIQPIHRYQLSRQAAAQALAARMRQRNRPAEKQITPPRRQATVVSTEAGSTAPPTCTLQFDTSGLTVPGVRFAEGLRLQAGDVVQVMTSRGDLWVVSKLAVSQVPAYIETTNTLSTVTTETFNTSTYLTVYLEAGRRYRVTGHCRPDSSTSNIVIVRIRYGTGGNPTSGSPVAAADEGINNTGAAGSRAFIPVGYPLISGSNGNRTFGMSVTLAGGGGSTGMVTGALGVIFVSVEAFN